MIVLDNLHKVYDGETVLNGLSLEVPEQLTLSILGKSGSGKSTLLKIMAGLESADSGSFSVHGEDMLSLVPQKRGVVYLSQEPLLFPHLSVFENLAYGLKIRKQDKAAIQKDVEVMADKLGLSEHLMKGPHQLSGGQKQRVSFGRALIINPNILLLDEPFGSLDTQTRAEMQSLFNSIRKEFSITALFVTHDLKEALLMGDRVAMMQDGNLQVFSSVEAFINDPGSGAADEIKFWKQFNL
ncbi:ABC transporter ATP-binding protein [Fulvivirga sp. M361]|uniref:ABC transporter ATP-binding protein n=1 Tax=Fulvivirga sp. M361 TaxID=2594266 RepID=UPI00117AFC88|nr:ABC transporter ATP-binding protein [Fulvivirga sp. M361]TRX52207.1 ABC transporter ATP-binding protein [Fulvivirga sp. M361]